MQREKVAKNFMKLERELMMLAGRFRSKYGGDLDEIQSMVREAFIDAIPKYDRERTTFTRWVMYYCWKQLLEKNRQVISHRNQLPRLNMVLEEVPNREERSYFNWKEFAGELSRDAKDIVHLVFESPLDIKALILDRGEPSPENIKEAVKEFLQEVGWTTMRIYETFNEIRNAL